MKQLSRRTLCAVLASATLPLAALAQSYPNRPVTVVSPFAAGGTSDVIARATSRGLEAQLGQPFVVVNRPGAGGTIGIASVLSAPQDGYNLVMGGLGSVVFPAVIYRSKIKYDPARDLVPVGVLGKAPTVIAVRSGLPVRNLRELIALAQSQPGKLSYGSAGTGGTLHVAGVLLEREAGITLNHVPYRGGAPAVTDLIAGNVDIALADMTLLKPALDSGRVRAIAVASSERLAALPGVQTTAEAGLPGARIDTWYALFAPAGTPAPVLQQLRSGLAAVKAKPALGTVLQNQGVQPMNVTPERFQAQLQQEFDFWLPLLNRICARSSCD